MMPKAQREAAISAPQEETQWSPAKKFGFRFLFSYFILYVYPRPIGSLGFEVKYSNPLRDMWHVVVPWVGVNWLHLTGPVNEVATGSGDQLYDYVQVLCVLMFAAVIAVIWSWVDSKRPNYSVLYQWLRLFVRMVVAVAMISYGTAKLFRGQFPEPFLASLLYPYARSSPMGLLWLFMGTSRLYSFFGGIGETVGGLLLLVPRFTAMGALISGGMMVNILLLNLGYDVPRKIYSVHLILMCVFLLAPELRRLLDFFVLNREAQLTQPVSMFLAKDKLLNYGVVLLQVFIGVGAVVVCCNMAYQDSVTESAMLPGPARGIWSVDQFQLDNVPRPPLLTDSQRWQHVVFDAPKILSIQGMDGGMKNYYMQLDSEGKSLDLWDAAHPSWRAKLNITDEQPDKMTLSGQFGDQSVTASLQRADISNSEEFLLLNRGFHWVTEEPLQVPHRR
jgi:uncharacterized membrane protein YphA (DoxX/SURF4 family)